MYPLSAQQPNICELLELDYRLNWMFDKTALEQRGNHMSYVKWCAFNGNWGENRMFYGILCEVLRKYAKWTIKMNCFTVSAFALLYLILFLCLQSTGIYQNIRILWRKLADMFITDEIENGKVPPEYSLLLIKFVHRTIALKHSKLCELLLFLIALN